MADEEMGEIEKSDLSKARGQAAANLPPGQKRRDFIAKQGNREAESKGRLMKSQGDDLKANADTVKSLGEYSDIPGGLSAKSYHKGGKVKGRKKGKVVRAKLKVGERVLTARQDKKYGKMKKMYKR